MTNSNSIEIDVKPPHRRIAKTRKNINTKTEMKVFSVALNEIMLEIISVSRLVSDEMRLVQEHRLVPILSPRRLGNMLIGIEVFISEIKILMEEFEYPPLEPLHQEKITKWKKQYKEFMLVTDLKRNSREIFTRFTKIKKAKSNYDRIYSFHTTLWKLLQQLHQIQSELENRLRKLA